MDWYVVDKNYINYLTQFDSRVGYVEYGERLKLHVGILLTIGDFHYYDIIVIIYFEEIIFSAGRSLFPLQNQNTRRCPTVWISTSSRMNPPDIFMLY